jgi:hypothetical protein
MNKYLFFAIAASLIMTGCTNTNKQNTAELGNSVQNNSDSESQWTEVSKLSADLNGDGNIEDVVLLKTKSSVDTNGVEEPVFGVKILVSQNNDKVFEYSPSEDSEEGESWGIGYYKQDLDEIRNFYIKEMTGDTIPEIVLKTETQGASDWNNCLTIVRYNPEIKQYYLVNKKDFCTSFNTGIDIRKISSSINGEQIIKAIPLNGEIGGNKIEQLFKIAVYTWNGNQFVKHKEYRSTREYEGGQSALDGEIYLIEKDFWTIP